MFAREGGEQLVLKGRRNSAWANGPGNRQRDQKRPEWAGESQFWNPFRVQTHRTSCPGAAFVAEAATLAPGYIPEAFQAYVPAIWWDTIQPGALHLLTECATWDQLNQPLWSASGSDRLLQR